MEALMLTEAQRQELRRDRVNELGTLPICPINPEHGNRVQRSDYIRCGKCGMNWLDGENWETDPKAERYHNIIRQARMKVTASQTKDATASPATAR